MSIVVWKAGNENGNEVAYLNGFRYLPTQFEWRESIYASTGVLSTEEWPPTDNAFVYQPPALPPTRGCFYGCATSSGNVPELPQPIPEPNTYGLLALALFLYVV